MNGTCSRLASCLCWGRKWNDRPNCAFYRPIETLPPFVEPPPAKVWFGNTLIRDIERTPGWYDPPSPGAPEAPSTVIADRSYPRDPGEPPASAEEAVEDVISECLEAFNLAAPKATAEERRAVRAILLTAANLWGIGRDRT